MNKFLVKSLVKYCLKKDNPIEYALRSLKAVESEAENWHEVITILKEREKSNVTDSKICKK